MGKGFNNYMCKKFFHPGSIDNLKRVWMAQQKHDAEKKKQEELKAQYDKEQELYNNKAMLAKGENKEKLSLNFMYEPPAGMKKDREREDGEPEFKFEWQRKYNGPRESYLSKDDDTIRDQPFGIQVRNVRCIKCKKWGHINTDKECELYTAPWELTNPTTSTDPLELMQGMRDGGLALKAGVVEGTEPIPVHQLVGSDEENGDMDSEEMQFIKSLSQKDKLKLLKKLKKLQKKNKQKKKKKQKSKKEVPDSNSSSDDSDNNEKVKRKNKKKSRNEISDSDSSSESEDERKGKKTKTKKGDQKDKSHAVGVREASKNEARYRSRSPRTQNSSTDRKRQNSSPRHNGYKKQFIKKEKEDRNERKSRHHAPNNDARKCQTNDKNSERFSTSPDHYDKSKSHSSKERKEGLGRKRSHSHSPDSRRIKREEDQEKRKKRMVQKTRRYSSSSEEDNDRGRENSRRDRKKSEKDRQRK